MKSFILSSIAVTAIVCGATPALAQNTDYSNQSPSITGYTQARGDHDRIKNGYEARADVQAEIDVWKSAHSTAQVPKELQLRLSRAQNVNHRTRDVPHTQR